MSLNLNHEDLELIRTAVGDPLADGGDGPVSVDEYVRSHSRLFGLVKSAMREVMAEHAPAVRTPGHADGSGQAESLPDPQLVVPDVSLVFGDALYRIRETDEGLLLVPRSRVGLGVVGGRDRILLHVLTSLLCVGGLIVALKLADSKGVA